MRVGWHAESSWPEIVDWKQRDVADAGVTLWGYGGSVGHPVSAGAAFHGGREGGCRGGVIWSRAIRGRRRRCGGSGRPARRGPRCRRAPG